MQKTIRVSHWLAICQLFLIGDDNDNPRNACKFSSESEKLLETAHSQIFDCFLYENQVLYHKKYTTFLIHNYLDTRRYWGNFEICENALPFGHSIGNEQ